MTEKKYFAYVEDTGWFRNAYNKHGYTFYGVGETVEEALEETISILKEDGEKFYANSFNQVEVDNIPLSLYTISEEVYNLLLDGEMWNLDIVDDTISEGGKE